MHSWFARLIVGYFAVMGLMFGLWAAFAPKHYFDNFPGGSFRWVSLDGPYNEHLMRDYGALNLALGALAVCALIWWTKPLILAVAIAEIVYALPHVIYHASHPSRIGDTTDQFGAIGGLAFGIVLAVVLIVLCAREPQDAAT